MATSRGKKFEGLFKEQFINTVPGSFCYRLIDATSGFYGVRNVSDYICYKYPYIYIIDCKSTQGNTINFNDIRQYEDMLLYKDIPGVNVGIVWWSVDNDKIIWVPISTLEKIKLEGKKSFNIKMVGDSNYPCFDIPSKKLRTYMKSDYSKLIEYCSEVQNGISC